MFVQMPDKDIINLAHVIAVEAVSDSKHIAIYTTEERRVFIAESEAMFNEMSDRLSRLLYSVPNVRWIDLDNLQFCMDQLRYVNVDEDGHGNTVMRLHVANRGFTITKNANALHEKLVKTLAHKCAEDGSRNFVIL